MARRILRYKPDHKSFGEFILSSQMRDVTSEVATEVAISAAADQPAPHSDTDPQRALAIYSVNPAAGTLKVSGNLRVMVHVVGTNAERAEFGSKGHTRYRTLARAGSRFGDWHYDPEKS